MNQDQFTQLLAELSIIAMNTTLLVSQGQKKGPLSDKELEENQVGVSRTAAQMRDRLKLSLDPWIA